MDIFSDQLDIGKLTLMSEAAALLDAQLRGLNRAVLTHGGNVSHTNAEAHAKAEYEKFDALRRTRRAEEAQKEIVALRAMEESLPKRKAAKKKKKKPKPPQS